MAVLQDQFEDMMREQHDAGKILPVLVRRVLTKRDIAIPDADFERVIAAVNHAIEIKSDSCEFELTSVDPAVSAGVTITSEDMEQALTEYLADFEVQMDTVLETTTEAVAPELLQNLYADLPNQLNHIRTQERGFERRLMKRWKSMLDRLAMLICVAHESGETYLVDMHRSSSEFFEENEITLINLLARLHAKACRTAREILCLLKSGYADGAMARWRSLYEIAVTAMCLAEHRGDLPQRYIEHAAVERFKAAEQYQVHCETLGYDKFTDEELADIVTGRDAVVAKYGKSFRHDHGWAAGVLNLERPTFSDIEKSLDMAKWRPYFKMACHNVHAGPQGMYFALGIPNDDTEMLLAGASDRGLADPAQNAGHSLMQATIALLTIRPNIDSLVACRCLMLICEHIGEAVPEQDEE